MDDIAKEVKLAIIEQEIAIRKNTIYQAQIRYRVSKKIGNTPEQLKSIENEIVQHEQALDELELIKKETQNEK